MVETAGTELRRARLLRQLSIEDASRATKIRVRQLVDLEGDDYSNFANLAYARSFLIAYGKYLKVDTRPYLDAFADASTFGLDDYQYLSETPMGVYRATRRSPRHLKPKRKQVILAGMAAGVMAIALFGRLMYNTYERLGDLDKIAERHEARARAVRDGQSAALTAPDTAPADAPATAPKDDASESVPVSTTPVLEGTQTGNNARLATVVSGSQDAPVELPALTSVAPVAADTMATPAVPILGDGGAVRELLTPQPAGKPDPNPVVSARRNLAPWHSPMFPADEVHPQKVVNNGQAPPLN